jgi:hypothetical protein
MSNQPRVAKVLAALLVSMTAGAVVLMAMSGNAPLAGPFCLSSYYKLNPVEKIIVSENDQSQVQWNRVEVFYSGTRAGNIAQLASLAGLRSSDDLDCHFLVCNGLGGLDGSIETTHKWLKQWQAVAASEGTIRICVVGDGNNVLATNSQIRRVEALIDKLSRNFAIDSEFIFYPNNWR